MAVKLLVNSIYNDKGDRQALAAMKRAQRMAKESGQVWDDAAKKNAASSIKAAQAADKQAEAMGKLSAKGEKLKSFGTAATVGLTVPILAAGAASVKTAADFETTMNMVQAATLAPQEEMKSLGSLAMKMGKDTVFSAVEAAQAVLELAKSGMTPAQISAGGLAATMHLAAAGGLDLATAATATANGINTFNLEATDAERVANALAGAANASSAEVSDLQEALAQVGPGAANAGLSIEDTTGSLAAFADNGIKGSDAGTSLKTMLARLVPTTKPAIEMMDKLGLSFVDNKGNIDDVTVVAQKLKDKIGGLSEEQRSQALTTIFGSDATRAATVYMNEGAEGIKGYVSAASSLIAAQEMSTAKMKGTAGAIESMRGSLETAGLVIGNVVAPTIKSLAEDVTYLTNAFTDLSPAAQQTSVIGAGVVSAIGPLALVVGASMTSLGGLSTMATAAGVSMGAMALAVAAPIAAFAVLAAGLGVLTYALIKYSQFKKDESEAVAWQNYLTSAIGQHEVAIRSLIAAKNASIVATNNLAGAEATANGASLNLEGSLLNQERAHKNVIEVKKKHKKGSLEYREAVNQEKMADAQVAAAKKSSAEAETKLTFAKGDVITAMGKQVDFAQREAEAHKKAQASKLAGDKAQRASMVTTGKMTRAEANKWDYYDKMYGLGAHYLEGFELGMVGKAAGLGDTVRSIMKEHVIGNATKLGQVKSPSRVMFKIGGHYATGFALGLKDKASHVAQEAEKMAQKVFDKIQAVKDRNADIRSRGRDIADTWGIFGVPTGVAEKAEAAAQAVYDRVQAVKDKNASIRSRGSEISNSWGLFADPSGSTDSTKTKVVGKTLSAGVWGTATTEVTTKTTLTSRLKSQISTLKTWQANLAKIAKSGASPALMRYLNALGPDAASDIASLAGLGKAGITGYSNLYSQKEKLGLTAAQTQMGKLGSEKAATAAKPTLSSKLRSQITTLKKWQTNLNKISKAGASKALMAYLREMGPDAADDIAGLAGLGRAGVKEYSGLFSQRQNLGFASATAEMGKLGSTNTTISFGKGSIVIHAGSMSENQVEKAVTSAIKKLTRAKKRK